MNNTIKVNSELICSCRKYMDIKTLVCFLGVDLIGDKADCPFCKAAQQFCVNTKAGIYTCFKCKAGGDLFAFVMQARNINFAAAVVWIMGLIAYKDPIAHDEVLNSVDFSI